MSESILPNDWTPGVADSDDGDPGITTAVSLYSDVAGQATHLRFYSTTTIGGTYTAGAWLVTSSDDTPAGTELQLETGGTPSSASFNLIEFDPPVDIAANTLYRFGLHNTDGRYAFKAGDYASGKTSAGGNLHAPANDTDPTGLGNCFQSTFSIGASIGYPGNDGNGAGYGIDVVFEPAVDPNEGSVASALVYTLAATGERESAGAPAVGLALTVAVSGDAPAVDPGEGVAPAALALAVAVSGDAPSIAASEGSVPSGLVYTLAGEGDTPIVTGENNGSTALGLIYSLAGAGTTPAVSVSDGTAGPGIRLTVAVAGDRPRTSVPNPAGWGSLLSMAKYNIAQREADQTRVISLCPVHAYPLEPGRAEGTLHCVFGGELFDLHGNPVFA